METTLEKIVAGKEVFAGSLAGLLSQDCSGHLEVILEIRFELDSADKVLLISASEQFF